eukprot:g37827.t1
MQNPLRLQMMGVDVMEDLQETNSQQALLFALEASKIIFQSRVHSMEQDETCSRFLFQKVHRESSALSSLKKEAGLYLALCDLIDQDLLEVYDNMLLAGITCESMRKDYKILSKVIANWVRSALGSVNHPDQICAVPGRTISESLMLLSDTMAYLQDRGMDTCFINLDQEKAFNRISHTYMIDIPESAENMVQRGRAMCKIMGGTYCQDLDHSLKLCCCSHLNNIPLHLEVHRRGKNVPNIALMLMATVVCSCTKLCVDPQYANTKCHYDPVLSGLFPGSHTKTNIDRAWRTINSVKDILRSARTLLVFQNKVLIPTDSRRLAHSKVQDNVLRDALQLEAAAAK